MNISSRHNKLRAFWSQSRTWNRAESEHSIEEQSDSFVRTRGSEESCSLEHLNSWDSAAGASPDDEMVRSWKKTSTLAFLLGSVPVWGSLLAGGIAAKLASDSIESKFAQSKNKRLVKALKLTGGAVSGFAAMGGSLGLMWGGGMLAAAGTPVLGIALAVSGLVSGGILGAKTIAKDMKSDFKISSQAREKILNSAKYVSSLKLKPYDNFEAEFLNGNRLSAEHLDGTITTPTGEEFVAKQCGFSADGFHFRTPWTFDGSFVADTKINLDGTCEVKWYDSETERRWKTSRTAQGDWGEVSYQEKNSDWTKTELLVNHKADVLKIGSGKPFDSFKKVSLGVDPSLIVG